ncbi:MAG: hypothetical protein HXP06_08050 [Trueperella pyogenes]|jgi:hypothetical protein|nr:hypothetical protein [Trueperella pyogenes]
MGALPEILNAHPSNEPRTGGKKHNFIQANPKEIYSSAGLCPEKQDINFLTTNSMTNASPTTAQVKRKPFLSLPKFLVSNTSL